MASAGTCVLVSLRVISIVLYSLCVDADGCSSWVFSAEALNYFPKLCERGVLFCFFCLAEAYVIDCKFSSTIGRVKCHPDPSPRVGFVSEPDATSGAA